MSDSKNPFGAAGQVYRKDRSDTTAWSAASKGKKKGGGSGPSSQEPSRSSSPAQRGSGSSTMTSDLLGRPNQPPLKQSNPPPKAKQPEQPAVSPAVKRILSLIESLQSESTAPAPKPCFCLARTHPLSRYTPLCTHCGFILCRLHPPSSPCPSCNEPLLTPTQRQAVLARLDTEMSSVLDQEEKDKRRKEEEERQRLVEESGGGAFPTLTGRPAPKPQPPQDRKVITLGAGRKPATVVTMHRVQPPPPKSTKAVEHVEPEEERIPRPGRQIRVPPQTALAELDRRPWVNLWLRVEDRPVYVPEVLKQEGKSEGVGEEKKKSRRRKGKAKEGESARIDTDAVEPSAGPS